MERGHARPQCEILHGVSSVTCYDLYPICYRGLAHSHRVTWHTGARSRFDGTSGCEPVTHHAAWTAAVVRAGPGVRCLSGTEAGESSDDDSRCHSMSQLHVTACHSAPSA